MRSRLLALAYHAIGDLQSDPVLARWSVRPEIFEAQLEAITGAGWSFVSLDGCLAALSQGRPIPTRSLLLTFDDGYADLLDPVLPILRRLEIPAVAFVVTDHVGGSNDWDVSRGARPLDLADEKALLRLAGEGVEIGSHSRSHRALSEVADAQATDEIAGSAQSLERLGLPRPRAFAYPYGDCPPSARAAVAAAGYELAFTMGPGGAVPSKGFDPLLLPRIVVLNSDSPSDLLLKLRTATWRSHFRRALLRTRRIDT